MQQIFIGENFYINCEYIFANNKNKKPQKPQEYKKNAFLFTSHENKKKKTHTKIVFDWIRWFFVSE